MMKRILVLVALAGLLTGSSGCFSTLAKSGYREFKQYSTSFLPYEADSGPWGTRYQTVQVEPVTDAAINGRAPAELKEKLVPLAVTQLTESGLFASANASGPAVSRQTLVIRGEIIHVDSGGNGATRTVGFGESPMLIVRTSFVDGSSGRVLATANMVSKAESALRDWSDVVSRGYGAALVKYLKETQGYEKPAESP